MKQIWAEKHRPNKQDSYIFEDSKIKELYEQCIKSKSIPNLLLSGLPGTGKSSLTRLLAKELIEDPNDLKIINGSINNKVEYIETSIRDFITTYSVGDFKLLIIEEADFLSASAQSILRSYTEDYTDSVRYIMTCNYANKLMPAIKSRFTHFKFDTLPYEKVIERCVEILKEEGIKPNLDIIDSCIDAGYPDMRKIIGNLQMSSLTGTMLPLRKMTADVDWQVSIIDLFNNKKFNEIINIIRADVPDQQMEDVLTALGTSIFNLSKWSNTDKELAHILFNDHLYKHNFVSHPQTNVVAFVLNCKINVFGGK